MHGFGNYIVWLAALPSKLSERLHGFSDLQVTERYGNRAQRQGMRTVECPKVLLV